MGSPADDCKLAAQQVAAEQHLRALLHIIGEIQASAAYNPIRRDHRITKSQFSAMSNQARLAKRWLKKQEELNEYSSH
jgi:hypothetical protein